MDIKDLKYYCKLIETKSYSKTAEFFNVTQPTISAMLKRLEKELKTKLVYKTTRSPMRVSHAGQITFNHAKNIIKEENMLNMDVKRSQNQNFVLGYSELAGKMWLPTVIRDLNRGHLLADIQTHQENSEKLKKHLLSGYYDAIVYSKLETQKSFGIKETILGNYQFKFLVPSNHPLAQNTEIDIYQIADTPLIMRHSKYLSSLALHLIFDKTGFVPKKKLYIDNIEAMKALVEDGMGIGFIMDANIDSNSDIKVISPTNSQKVNAYTCLGIRNDFLPNEYQQKYLDILSKQI